MVKIPGTVWILFSFFPWIIYWSACGFHYAPGIIYALIVSALLTAAGIFRKNPSLMDVVTFCFFLLAGLATFVLDAPFFVKNSGLAGYATLFLMAAGSVLAGSPFTFQVAKKDYPEVYWDDPAFLKTNNIISLVWGGIFLANAFLSRAPDFQVAVLYPNLLVAAAVVFSFFFPRWYPVYLYQRSFPRYGNWQVDLAPGSKYDVVIVGAGIGGLTCGALLAKRGLKVLMLEQHDRVGGYCTSFRRKDFVFDGGVESISGLGEKGPVRHLFRELGLDPEGFFVRTREEYIIGDRRIKVSDNMEEFGEILGKEFSQEKENISRFFQEVKEVYREIYQDVEKTGGTPLPPVLIYQVMGKKALLDYPRDHSHHYRWMRKSFQEVLDVYFTSRELKSFLSVLTAYLGARPDELSADAMAIIFGYYIDGGYYPWGGTQHLADALAEVIKKQGGEILTSQLVKRIIVENGAVRGVAVNGKEFRTNIVVSNANAKDTFFSLVGKENLPGWFVKNLRKLKESVSAFLVYLGLNADLSGYPPLLKVEKNGEVGIVINSNLDPALAPPGKTSLHLITLLPADTDFGEGEKYKRKKKEFAEKLISVAEQVIPDLRQQIVVQDAATPKTFARYTLNPKGCIYGFEQSRHAPPRPYFKTPVRGLYLAGASTFPGGGIEATVISGIIAANDITGWKRIKK